MISDRQEVTSMIISSKVSKGIKWSEVSDKLGLSKEWVTAACLGQMAMEKDQAETVGEIFETSWRMLEENLEKLW